MNGFLLKNPDTAGEILITLPMDVDVVFAAASALEACGFTEMSMFNLEAVEELAI